MTNMNPIFRKTVRPFWDPEWHEYWGRWRKRTSCVILHDAWFKLFCNDLIRFKFHFIHQIKILFRNKLKAPNSDVHFISSKLYNSRNKKRLNHIMHTWSSFLSDWVLQSFCHSTFLCMCRMVSSARKLFDNLYCPLININYIHQNVLVYKGSNNVWHVAQNHCF